MTRKEEKKLIDHAQRIYNNCQNATDKEYKKESLTRFDELQEIYYILTDKFLIINE